MKSLFAFGLFLVSAVAFAQTSTNENILSKLANPAPTKSVLKKNRAASAAGAATNTSTATYTQTSSSRSLFSADHFSAGLGFMGGSDLRGGIGLDMADKKGSLTGSTSPGLALIGQYRAHFAPEWAMAGVLAIHQSKNISNMRGSLDNQKGQLTLNSKPSFQPWILGVNGEYHLNDYIYFPVGLNTTIFNSIHAGEFDSMTMDPRLGFQLGVGGTLNKMFEVELQYQSVRYGFAARKNDVYTAGGNVSLDGVNLSGRYQF